MKKHLLLRKLDTICCEDDTQENTASLLALKQKLETTRPQKIQGESHAATLIT